MKTANYFVSPTDVQHEYVEMTQRGIGFAWHGDRAHYYFRPDQMEPSILAKLPTAAGYIWTIFGGIMSTKGVSYKITPYDGSESWLDAARRVRKDGE